MAFKMLLEYLCACLLQWMDDFEAFQAAVEGDSSYSSSLSRSLCLVLDEFYKNLSNAGVSAVTGEGIEDFFHQVDKCADEYMESYRYVYQAGYNVCSNLDGSVAIAFSVVTESSAIYWDTRKFLTSRVYTGHQLQMARRVDSTSFKKEHLNFM